MFPHRGRFIQGRDGIEARSRSQLVDVPARALTDSLVDVALILVKVHGIT